MANTVATKKKQEVATNDLLSMFEAESGAGLENLTQDDLALPFIKILSGLDPILDEREDARKGDLYNTVSGQVYKGKEGIRVVPCAYQKRFIQWAPRGSGNGAPSAIKSTQLKKSRKWNSMAAAAQEKGANGNVFSPPRYAYVYELKTISEENSKGSWHGWEISREGLIDSQGLFARAKDFHDTVMSGDVVVKHEGDTPSASSDIPF
mgnify:CR=1 FL=1